MGCTDEKWHVGGCTRRVLVIGAFGIVLHSVTLSLNPSPRFTPHLLLSRRRCSDTAAPEMLRNIKPLSTQPILYVSSQMRMLRALKKTGLDFSKVGFVAVGQPLVGAPPAFPRTLFGSPQLTRSLPAFPCTYHSRHASSAVIWRRPSKEGPFPSLQELLLDIHRRPHQQVGHVEGRRRGSFSRNRRSTGHDGAAPVQA